MPTELLLDIPKFEGKEDPSNHVTTFHLWCSSNSIIEDFMIHSLFQRTLTGIVAKWYTELPLGAHTTFAPIATVFLTFFQLPIRHDTGVEVITTFRKPIATHITDQILEWRRRCNVCKMNLEDPLFMDWFLKSILPSIAKDVAATMPQTEEEAILKAQQFDLMPVTVFVYCHSGRPSASFS